MLGQFGDITPLFTHLIALTFMCLSLRTVLNIGLRRFRDRAKTPD